MIAKTFFRNQQSIIYSSTKNALHTFRFFIFPFNSYFFKQIYLNFTKKKKELETDKMLYS